MSSEAELASYIQYVEETDVQLYCQAALFALFGYDYLLTFGREVDLIWRMKFTPATYLYILTRYSAMHSLMMPMILTYNTPDCTALYKWGRWSGNVSSLASTIVLIARTYAICDQSRLILCVLAVLGVACLLPSMWENAVQNCSVDGFTHSAELKLAIASIGQLVFQTTIIVLTVYKTWSVARLQTHLKSFAGRGLAYLILKNGSLYFSVIFLLELMNVLLFFLAPLYLQSLGGAFTFPLDVIFICRFLLDIRQQVAIPMDTSTFQLPHFSSLHVTMQQARGSIMDDFGDPLYRMSAAPRRSEDLPLEESTDVHRVRY